MNIVIDIDDTIADLMDAWLYIYNRKYKDNLSKNEIKGWDISIYTRPECGNNIYKILDMNGLYELIFPIEGAIEGVSFLKSRGHKITYVTAYDHTQEKLNWLTKYGFTNNKDDLIVAHDKSRICGDLIIDDKFANVVNFNNGTGILFKQPWNEAYSEFASKTYWFMANNWRHLVSSFAYFLTER